MKAKKKEEEKTQISEAELLPDEETIDASESAASENSEDTDLAAAINEFAAAYGALEKERDAITAEKEQLEQQVLRLSADFDNFRKRTNSEKEQWRHQIVGGIIGDLLPILDNFRLALDAMGKDPAVANHTTGVEMIYRQFHDSLVAKGLEVIPALDQPFDPQWHEAVGQDEVTEKEKDGIILQELKPGYRIGDKLIRPSMVRVGKYNG